MFTLEEKEVSKLKENLSLIFLIYQHSVWFHHFLVIWEAKAQKGQFVFLYVVSWQKNNIMTTR